MAEGSFDPKDFENLEKNLKAAKRFSKDVNTSFSNWARNFEKINDYGEAISDKVKLISELEEQIAKAGKDVTEEQLAQLANEKEKVKIMQSELKLMRKQISLTKTLKNETLGFLSKQTALIGKSLTMYNEVDKSVRDVSMSMGISAQQMSSFRSSVGQVNVKFQELGYSAGEAAATQGAFAEETGRVAMLSNQTLGTMAELGRLTGVGAKGMGEFAGQMDAYGFSAEKSMEYTKEIMDVSQTMGVSSGKVIKKVQKNLSLLNKLDFKGGVKGMIKMAAYSEKYKISMEAVAGVAEKVFRPEGAIEAAANLQMLGGSLSQLGDPFDLMYKARYAPEELAKSLSQAASQSAVFNKETGEFELNALELDRMREAASALGMDMGELVQTAKQTAKINMFKGMFTGMSPDDKETLAGMVQMKDGKAAITIDGQTKFVDDLNQTQIKGLLEQKKASEKNAEIAQTTQERWTALQNQLIATVDPLIAVFDGVIRPTLVSIQEWLSGLPEWGKGLLGIGVLLTAAIGKLASWYMKGLWLGKGFNTATTGKGSFLSNLNPFKKKGGNVTQTLTTGQQSVAGPLTKSGKPDMRYKANRTTSLGKQASSGPSQMGNQAGSSAGNMLKGAAAILVVAAAMFVFAKALQEFEKLKNGWETLAIAGVSLAGLTVGLWALSKIPKKDLLVGALALTLMGAAMIPFAYAMSLMEGLSWETLAIAGVALIGFTTAMFGLGALMMTGVGTLIFGAGILAFIALGGALAVFGLGLQEVVEPIKHFSEAMALMTNVDFGGIVSGIQQVSGALTDIDNEGLDKLRETAIWLSIATARPVRVEFDDLEVKGDINLRGQGGVTVKSELLNDTSFVSALRSKILEQGTKEETGSK